MVKRYPKGSHIQLSSNFTTDDFDCKCHHPFCTYTLVDTDLIDGLDVLSDAFAKLDIDSGFRCSVHNSEVGGRLGSQHMLGRAADVKSIFAGLSEMYFAAVKIEHFLNGGIGIYSKKNFIHLDVRGFRARWGDAIEGE